MSAQKVYVNQPLSIDLAITDSATDLPITPASATMAYQGPNGSPTGEWPATVNGSHVVTSITAGILNRVGVWKVQALIGLPGGSNVPASTYSFNVLERFSS